MALNADVSLASSDQIEVALYEQIASYRLENNISQKQLADEAGVSVRTIKRMESGKGISVDTLVRVLKALNLAENIDLLIPESGIRPLDRVDEQPSSAEPASPSARQRARPQKKQKIVEPWTWNE